MVSKMIMLLSEELRCFLANTKLVGRIQKRQFQMMMTNFEDIPLKCIAFNNTLSTAYLNYEESGIVKSISTEFQYLADRPLVIDFNDIEKDIFDFMATLSIISYTISLEKQLEIFGTFSSIQNTLVNTSSCWQPMTFEYSRSGATSHINLTAQPNDCQIRDPVVNVQFQLKDIWLSILIKPISTTEPGYQGYKLPFIHLETLYYEQFYSDMDKENQQLLDLFFKSFSDNRHIKMRLVLKFSQLNSSLSQQIISIVANHKSSNNDCLTAITPFVAVSYNYLTVVGNLSNLISCIADYENMKINATAVFNGVTLHFDQELIALSKFVGIPFNFKEQTQEDILEGLELPDTMIYLTIFKDEVMREEAVLYKSIGSCFSKLKTLVSNKNTCLVLFPIQNERCNNLYENGTVTQFQQILQFNQSSSSRVAYQTFEFVLFIKDQKFNTICFNKKDFVNQSTYPFYPGSYRERQKEYIKQIHRSFQPLSSFSSNISSQFEYNSGIDENSSIIFETAIIFIVILAVTGLGITLLIVKTLQ